MLKKAQVILHSDNVYVFKSEEFGAMNNNTSQHEWVIKLSNWCTALHILTNINSTSLAIMHFACSIAQSCLKYFFLA